ncbi:MAG TPA: hypothetical protein VLJ37_10585 [bacterium]|nr:hypothetical protein [bacterium]
MTTRFRRLNAFLFLLLSATAFAGAPEKSREGDEAIATSGQAGAEADRYYAAYKAEPRGKNAAENLIKTGRALDAAKLKFYEEADGRCYLGKKSERQARPECFEAAVADLNRRYGEGSFSYHGDQVQFTYNGTHFKKVLDEFPGSPYEGEASLALLRGGALVSDDPNYGINKVIGWLDKYPSSNVRSKALLLLGRLYADAFVTFKSGGFIVVNGRVDPGRISMERSKYQAKGLEAFQEVFQKYGSSPEAGPARKEYDLLKNGQDDGIFYGVSY